MNLYRITARPTYPGEAAQIEYVVAVDIPRALAIVPFVGAMPPMLVECLTEHVYGLDYL